MKRTIKKLLAFYIFLLCSFINAQEEFFPSYPFNPVEDTGLPYHIIVSESSINGIEAAYDSEIAIFDGELCVGVGQYDPNNTIVVWGGDDNQSLQGFIQGNPKAIRKGSRYIDFDLNRSFNKKLIANKNQTYEVSRAQALVREYGPHGLYPCHIAVDLHTTTSAMGTSIVVYGRRKSRDD